MTQTARRGMMKMKNQYFLMTVTAMAKRYDNISNNNNNNRFYIALFTPGGRPKALHIITPGHWALNHSLNHLSSLVGSMQPVQH